MLQQTLVIPKVPIQWNEKHASELYLVRHGETSANQTKKIVGITDVPLNEVGFKQAHQLGEVLSDKNLQCILTSPQQRAVNTWRIIQKYQERFAPLIELPFFHPQDFGLLEGLSLNGAKENGLERFIHTPETDKYLHCVDWWESARDMERRINPIFHKIDILTRTCKWKVALIGHNSIYRCILWNKAWLPPKIWLEKNLENAAVHAWQGDSDIPSSSTSGDLSSLQNKLHSLLSNDVPISPEERRSELARLVILDENWALENLKEVSKNSGNPRAVELLGYLNNSMNIQNTVSEIINLCSVNWVYWILQFWSSVTWKHYSISNSTDLDIEIIFDQNFDITTIPKEIFEHYEWDINSDFQDFLTSSADYFSLKTYFQGRLVDLRITHKRCFDAICKSSLSPDENHIMHEFRKKPRPNGIVPLRKSFDWREYQWHNSIELTDKWQIIHYPLYQYYDGKFIAWNNIDKYCSFTESFVNPVSLKKKLFELQKQFLTTFHSQQYHEYIQPSANIQDIFIRKDRFPLYLANELSTRYRIYSLLSS